MSDATPAAADWQLAQPLRDAFERGELSRYEWWHTIQPALLDAHPNFSGHDATRVARIMAPFPLRDDRFAAR